MHQHQCNRFQGRRAWANRISCPPAISRHVLHARVQTASVAAQTATPGAPAVVITGCSSGIGRATAILLAQQGWHVFAGVRKACDGAALQQQLATTPVDSDEWDHSIATQATGAITPVIIDVTQPETVTTAAEVVRETLQAKGELRLRGLINNAGKVTLAPLEHMPVDVFEDMLQVNLVGALRVTQAFLPLMRTSQQLPTDGAPMLSPRIINISSQSGTMAFPLFGGYCASKFGLEGFNDCLKFELADQGIDVICVKPGAIKSDIWSRAKGPTTQVINSLPPEGMHLYGVLIEKMARATHAAEENGGTCEELAELLSHILTASKPRDRYLWGKKAVAQMVLRRLLPDRIWNPIVLKSIKKL